MHVVLLFCIIIELKAKHNKKQLILRIQRPILVNCFDVQQVKKWPVMTSIVNASMHVVMLFCITTSSVYI